MAENLTFSEYLRWYITKHKGFQLTYLSDENEIILDYVGKLENFNEDIAKICKKINVHIYYPPYENRSEHKPYREYYSKEDVELVRRTNRKIVKLFNYSF